MTNEQRQKSLEKKRKVKCGGEYYCKYCKMEEQTPCAKAYNRMVYENSKRTIEREKYSWRNDF